MDGKLAKTSDLCAEAVGDLFVGGEGESDVGVGLGEHGENFIALSRGQRFGDAAGDDPSGMNALFAEQFNDALAKAAQRHTGAAQLRVGGDDSKDCCARRGRTPMPNSRSGDAR